MAQSSSVAGSCEHVNKPLGFMKENISLVKKILVSKKKDSALCHYYKQPGFRMYYTVLFNPDEYNFTKVIFTPCSFSFTLKVDVKLKHKCFNKRINA